MTRSPLSDIVLAGTAERVSAVQMSVGDKGCFAAFATSEDSWRVFELPPRVSAHLLHMLLAAIGGTGSPASVGHLVVYSEAQIGQEALSSLESVGRPFIVVQDLVVDALRMCRALIVPTATSVLSSGACALAAYALARGIPAVVVGARPSGTIAEFLFSVGATHIDSFDEILEIIPGD